MENKINIAEILKDCPKGTKLYSPIYGEIELWKMYSNSAYPIWIATGNDRKGIRLGMKEEGHCKYWHRGSIVRWWTRERHKQRKYVRKHPGTVIWI